MNKKRIFIAINLSEKVRKRLKEYREKFDYIPVRWTKIPSLHLTLVFIGYVDNEQMLEACKTAREVASGFEPFFINFKRVALGPSFASSLSLRASEGKPTRAPRMIWLEMAASEELNDLKKKLEEALVGKDAGLQKIENRSFSPHITLARISPHTLIKSQGSDVDEGGNKLTVSADLNGQKGVGVKMEQWREAQINPAEVEQEFKVQFEVNSIEVMESDLKFDGAEYATLESCPLGD